MAQILCNRTQFTRINGYDSNVQRVTLGVPQGSCLGPLLFYIYINDLPNAINNSNVYTHADDTCISLQTDSIPDINEAFNMDLEAFYAWRNGNRLSLNLAKTQSMTIATKHKRAALENQKEQLHLQIHNETLEVV